MRNEQLKNGLCSQYATLHGTGKLTYLNNMCGLLGSIRLIFGRAQPVFQKVLSSLVMARSAG